MGLPPDHGMAKDGLFLRRTASCYATLPIFVYTLPPHPERGDAVEVWPMMLPDRSTASRGEPRAGKSIGGYAG